MRNVVIIHNIIAPYRIELFEQLARLPDLGLTVLFCSETQSNRQWAVPKELQFPYQVLPGAYLNLNGRHIHVNSTLWVELRKLRPDVIISGGFSIPTSTALFYAWTHKIPLIVWSGGTSLSERRASSLQKALRKFIIHRAQGFIAYGSEARDYLASFVARRGKIWIAGNATFDVERYHSKVVTLRAKKAKMCKEHGWPGNLILAVGQLIDRKNYALLIDVFQAIYDQFPNWGLIIVGTGPLYEALSNGCRKELGSGSVFLAGHVEPGDLPLYYAVADIFVHPAKLDQWPQVINEAMASALPIIVTNCSGVGSDLIPDGQAGFIIEPEKKALQTALVSMLSDIQSRQRMGRKAFEMIRCWDVHHAVDTFKTAIYQTRYTQYE